MRVSTALQRRGYLECRWVVPSHTAGSTHWNTIRENHDAPASPPLMRGSSGSPSSCAATGAYPSLLIFLPAPPSHGAPLAYNAPTGRAAESSETPRLRRTAHASGALRASRNADVNADSSGTAGPRRERSTRGSVGARRPSSAHPRAASAARNEGSASNLSLCPVARGSYLH